MADEYGGTRQTFEDFGNGCRNKVGFPSKRNAEGKLRALRYRDANRMSTYKCRACGRWHIGHTPAHLR